MWNTTQNNIKLHNIEIHEIAKAHHFYSLKNVHKKVGVSKQKSYSLPHIMVSACFNLHLV